MDLAAIDEDPAAAIAAAEAAAAASVTDEQLIFSTPDRKMPISKSSSNATTPATGYFSYGNDYRSDYRHRYPDDHDSVPDQDLPGMRTPSLLSSPSVASSLGFSTGRLSPLRRELSGHSRHSSHHDPEPNDASPTARRGVRLSRSNRDTLARRLSQLAHELTSGNDDVDDVDVDLLTAQLDHLEASTRMKKTVSFSSNPSTPSPRPTPRRPLSVDMRSPGDSLFSSPGSSIFRTRFSDLSASIRRDPEPEPEPEPDPPPNMGMTVAQAKKVINEVTQLNEEMSQLVANLKARQEESEHIQGLLIERAERAAQRIIFLQNRVSHLEQELRENDDELQHLRICLKAVEIQLPPHPDKELQRCLSSFKQDYQAMKRKRVNRASIASLSSLGSPYPGSPA
ncbi:hypothetical protein CEP54_001968 [Fusarium duplospermum]|uniref:Uncharacterized protein n=1 Tax=Fusarium duplospermum TaxID=1325734 RepID=A0A428QXC0_9HYPO|nr:hypothetical protein CEP54_001968 [Fusarium duplospermum]